MPDDIERLMESLKYQEQRRTYLLRGLEITEERISELMGELAKLGIDCEIIPIEEMEQIERMANHED